MIRWLCAIILCCGFAETLAQRSEQLWLDFQLSYPFANRYLLENTTSYQTLLKKDGKWRSFSISPTFEYTLFTWLDLLSEIPIGYTQQSEGTNTFEFTPIVGGRFTLTQNKRVTTRLTWRYQVRAFREIEDHDWDVSNRTRLKGEILIALNKPNLFTDKVWHAFLDYEEFIVLDQQLDERFANRRRARIGLGYRLNYQHRFDLSYARQSTRNELEGEFISADNIIQFKYKLYIRWSPPTPQE